MERCATLGAARGRATEGAGAIRRLSLRRPEGRQHQLYYESIDLEDAFHPQTILAYDLNDRTLPIPNGAPVRLRVERQLGYKHAKYVMRMELVESFEKIRGGKGGYWEDQGYEWWAGI